MSIWDSYENRIAVRGNSKRETFLRREQHMLSSKLSESLSYHSVIVDGVACDVAIINSDNLDEKKIYSTIPGEIRGGSLVEWMDNHWLVTELDANSEVYTMAKMTQCNHLLKWIDDEGKICEHWCIVADGTKYLTGEYEDRNFIVTRGDSRISVTVAKNEDTVKLGRKNRFLIDDTDSSEKLSYTLSKPLKVGWVYNTDGVYSFVLQEVATTDYDNHELGIADYYKYFPKELITQTPEKPSSPLNKNADGSGRKVWL